MRENIVRVSCDKCGVRQITMLEGEPIDLLLVQDGWKFAENKELCPVCAHSLAASIEWHKWLNDHKELGLSENNPGKNSEE